MAEDQKGSTSKVTGPAKRAEAAQAVVDKAGIGVAGFAAALARELGKGVSTAQVEAAVQRILAAADAGDED